MGFYLLMPDPTDPSGIAPQDLIPDTDELWDEIGFHRPLAGFWYNLMFTMLVMLSSIVISGVLLNYFYPKTEKYSRLLSTLNT